MLPNVPTQNNGVQEMSLPIALKSLVIEAVACQTCQSINLNGRFLNPFEKLLLT
jgi:hypothetical protein